MKKIEIPGVMKLSDKRRDGKDYISTDCFLEWFEKEVEPINKMLDEAVEVYGYSDLNVSNHTYASDKQECDTHKALLINIQPIKKETAEEILQSFMDLTNIPIGEQITLQDIEGLIDRVRKYFFEKED